MTTIMRICVVALLAFVVGRLTAPEQHFEIEGVDLSSGGRIVIGSK